MKLLTLCILLFSFGMARAATEKVVLAGGCFWCLESPFEELAGVISVESGYTGGRTSNPKYKEVSSGKTGHIEAVEVTFDNTKISLEKILSVFWKNIDPLDASGQFCDKGEQYTSGIFFASGSQKAISEKSLSDLASSSRFKGKKIVTFIRSGTKFYRAEDYHQDYFKKNPLRYKYYRFGCGRDKRLEEVWGER